MITATASSFVPKHKNMTNLITGGWNCPKESTHTHTHTHSLWTTLLHHLTMWLCWWMVSACKKFC